MATPNKIIEYVDKIRPNTFSDEEKFRWLCDLDGMIKQVVMQEEEGVHYAFPDDLDSTLLVPAPFEGLYAQYLEAQIDLHHRDYAAYNNSAKVFETTFANYKKAYLRRHRPKCSGGYQGVW